MILEALKENGHMHAIVNPIFVRGVEPLILDFLRLGRYSS
jgi:hypothetical protein